MIDERTANRFTRYMKKYPELYQELSYIVHRTSSSPRPLILDVGAGSGLLASELQRTIPQATIIGLDPHQHMLQLAIEQTNRETFQPLRGAVEHLPFSSDTFDIIVSRFSIHYWHTPEEGVQEIFRVLKPGGYVVVESLNKDFPSWKRALVKLHMFLKFAGSDVVRYHSDAYQDAFTSKHLEDLFMSLGFLIKEKKGGNKEWKFTLVAHKPRK